MYNMKMKNVVVLFSIYLGKVMPKSIYLFLNVTVQILLQLL